jgi:hypothetical protein
VAYLPPPPPPPTPARRPPRWSSPHALGREVAGYLADDQMAGRRIRRMLAPGLAALAEAATGSRAERHRVAQTAITVALADLETHRIPTTDIALAFRCVAYVVDATDHALLDWLETLTSWERGLVRLLDVELADPDGVARAFGLDADALRRQRSLIAEVIGLAPPRESGCPGWPDVRAALRTDDAGAQHHRETCGRCTLIAEQTVARRRRLWRPGVPVGRLAAPFEPRRRP